MSTTTPRLTLYKADGGDNYNRLNDLNNMKDTVDDLTRYNQPETITGDWKHSGTEQHGDDTNNMTTAIDGFVTLNGTARAAIDIKFPMTRLKKGGISDPAETLVGVTYTFGFDATSDEEVFAKAELPHIYSNGTDLQAHFHWAPSDGTAGNVTWGLEYHITRPENNEVLTEATTTAIVVDATQSLQDEHLESGDIVISGTGVQSGDFVHLRIFRDANASEGGASDTYAADANLIEFDIRIMVDGFGKDLQW